MIKKIATIMTMPCTLTFADKKSTKEINDAAKTVFNYLISVDETFSPFKPASEISRINRKEIKVNEAKKEVQDVLKLCNQTKKVTADYFNVVQNDQIDPCGLVKGWAILNAAKLLSKMGFKNFMVEIAGDIQASGHPKDKNKWTLGIRNPFDITQVVKSVKLNGKGIATSGTYMQGLHIYDPVSKKPAEEILSLTVIGPNVYEADRFATAAFAMGEKGIKFIENYPGLEGYAINHEGIATYTSKFATFTK